VAILLQLIHGIVDEALWSRDVGLANGTGEAVRVKLHALVFKQIDGAQDRLIAADASSHRHLEMFEKLNKSGKKFEKIRFEKKNSDRLIEYG